MTDLADCRTAAAANTMDPVSTKIVAAPSGGLLPGCLASNPTRGAGLTITARDKVFMNFRY